MRRTSSIAITILFLASLSAAQEESQAGRFTFPSWVMIPASAFATTGAFPDSYYLSSSGYISGTPTGDGCVRAPVYFPQGAKIEFLRAWIADLGVANVTVSLKRVSNWLPDQVDTVASVTSSWDTADYVYNMVGTASNPAYSDVIYHSYSYYVETCLPTADFRLNQVSIEYSGDTLIFDDGFESGNTSSWHYYGNPLTVPAADFRPQSLGSSSVRFSYVEGYLYGSNYDSYRWVNAPVHLPENATVTSVLAIVMDDDPGDGTPEACAASISDVYVSLKRVYRDGTSDTMFSASSSGAESYPRVLGIGETITEPVVSYPNYTYYLTARICGPKHRIYGFRVHYTM